MLPNSRAPWRLRSCTRVGLTGRPCCPDLSAPPTPLLRDPIFLPRDLPALPLLFSTLRGSFFSFPVPNVDGLWAQFLDSSSSAILLASKCPRNLSTSQCTFPLRIIPEPVSVMSLAVLWSCAFSHFLPISTWVSQLSAIRLGVCLIDPAPFQGSPAPENGTAISAVRQARSSGGILNTSSLHQAPRLARYEDGVHICPP